MKRPVPLAVYVNGVPVASTAGCGAKVGDTMSLQFGDEVVWSGTLQEPER